MTRKTPVKPDPTQKEADQIREDAVGEDVVADAATDDAAPKAKAKGKAKPAVDAPFPSQAELDAIKEGTYSNREMKTD